MAGAAKKLYHLVGDSPQTVSNGLHEPLQKFLPWLDNLLILTGMRCAFGYGIGCTFTNTSGAQYRKFPRVRSPRKSIGLERSLNAFITGKIPTRIELKKPGRWAGEYSTCISKGM